MAAKRSRAAGKSRGRAPSRIGLALAGGGPLGGIYEIGTLLALEDSLEGLDLNAADVYVGVSSGAFVASGLVNGITAGQMYRMFIADHGDWALTPRMFLRPSLVEFAHRLMTLPQLLTRATFQYWRDPFGFGAWQSLGTLAHVLPAGVFDNAAIEEYLVRLFAAPGRSNDFRALRAKLFLVATELDSGAPVVFGAKGRDAVPISRAIAASAALPGIFPPVSIDGADYVDGAIAKTLHASLALEERIDLLLCVNPLVPFDVRGAAASAPARVDRLHQGGLPLVLAQTLRTIVHSRMKTGMEQYLARYPGADVVLFEPARADSEMFFASLMTYGERRVLCATSFRKTRADLAKRARTLGPRLARHGIRIRHDRLADPGREIGDAVGEPPALRLRAARTRKLAPVTSDLAQTLDQLDTWLSGGRAAI